MIKIDQGKIASHKTAETAEKLRNLAEQYAAFHHEQPGQVDQARPQVGARAAPTGCQSEADRELIERPFRRTSACRMVIRPMRGTSRHTTGRRARLFVHAPKA
jgi:hypothetical protein